MDYIHAKFGSKRPKIKLDYKLFMDDKKFKKVLNWLINYWLTLINDPKNGIEIDKWY